MSNQPPTLTLTPPNTEGERILLFGPEGAGKTYATLRMIEASQGRGYILDTDRSIGRFLSSTRWAGLRDKVEYEEPINWPDYTKAAKKWLNVANGQDWLSIDLFGRAWDEVQAYYIEEVFGISREEHLLGYRKHLQENKGKGSRSEFSADLDWPTIKGLYRALTDVVLKWPGHVCLVAGKKAINPQYDDPGTQARFEPVGSKVDAEKTAGHLVHTILYLEVNRRMTSLKDRERKLLDGQKVDDMALSYLVSVAGWRPVA